MTHERAVRWTKWMLIAAAMSLALPLPTLAQGSARDAGLVSARIAPAIPASFRIADIGSACRSLPQLDAQELRLASLQLNAS